MQRNLGEFVAAGALLLTAAVAPAAFAQKSGGVLVMSHFDSAASMSMHEEATGAVNRPMMGVFNNLVQSTRGAKQHGIDRAGPGHRLVVERGGNRADFAVAQGRPMA
jgi:hypothetical protein